MNISLKRILIGTILLGAVVGTASTTLIHNQDYLLPLTPEQRVENIFDKIRVATGEPVGVNIKYIESLEINAWTDGENITITSGLLKQIDNDDELAAIIGHEMAHVTLQHLDPQNKVSQPNKEGQADKMGAWYMMKAGYDICKGKMIFVKFKNMFGDCADCDHPANAYRLDQLSLPNCPVKY